MSPGLGGCWCVTRRQRTAAQRPGIINTFSPIKDGRFNCERFPTWALIVPGKASGAAAWKELLFGGSGNGSIVSDV